MAKKKISPKGNIFLAVEVVRNLEHILIKASRRRKLTTEHRQKLLKCASYLRKKRKKATKSKVLLQESVWLKVLRFLRSVIKNAKYIKYVFDALDRG